MDKLFGKFSLENLEIKLKIDETYSKQAENTMRNRLQSQLGNVNVSFCYVDEIEKTPNGKFKAVISKLSV